MGCGQKAAANDYAEYCDWKDNLSEGELKLIDIRKELKQVPDDFALKRDQIKEVDDICNQILKITNGTKHRWELDG